MTLAMYGVGMVVGALRGDAGDEASRLRHA